MKRIWAFILACLCALPAQAQETTTLYLPFITNNGRCTPMTDPILRVTDGKNSFIDLLGPGSGWELADPYWQPQIAQFKGGGEYSNSGMAEGQQLTHREYDNVVETIPLSVRGIDQGRAIQTIRDLLQLGRQASDYWTESYEYDDVWLEVKPGCDNSLTGYSRIVKMSIPELKNPFGQPFFSSYGQPVMEDISLIIEREPFWRGTPPGEIIGPLYNLIKNPDFEQWNFGTIDAQPDSWSDLETLWITGDNNVNYTPKFGNAAIKIVVRGSTKAGASKGVTQVLSNIEDNTEYTILAWVRSEGVSNGVGRILITYSNQLELYRSSTAHGWTLYTGKITTGISDVVAISCEILTTAANTDGKIYIDSLMFVRGDWEEEAENGILPYLSSSQLVNYWSKPENNTVTPGNVNWLDVWNVPGDVDSLVRIEVVNNTTISDYTNITERIKKLRIGQRRTGKVLNFDNYNDVIGAVDATGSGNDSITSPALTPNDYMFTTETIKNNIIDNLGRYRLYARVYDNRAGSSNLKLKTSYFMGMSNVNNKTLDEVISPIRGNWEIVDLTPNATVNFTKGDKQIIPSSLGYNVYVKRPSGADTVKLDYTLLMPTDGGFAEIEMNPGSVYGESINIDYSLSSADLSLKLLTGGSIKVDFDSGTYRSYDAVEFNGDTYVCGQRNPGADYLGRIWRKRNGYWSLVYDNNFPTAGGCGGLVVFNNKLYCNTFQRPGAVNTIQMLVSSDGASWSTISYPIFLTTAGTPVIYNNKIWFSSNSFPAGPLSYIMNFDGTNFATTRIYPALTVASDVVTFSGRLYAVKRGVGTYSIEWTTDGITWTTIYTTATDPGQPSQYNPKYLLFSSNPFLLRTADGTSFEIIPTPTDPEDATYYNDKIYYSDDLGRLYSSEDGHSFNLMSTLLSQGTASVNTNYHIFNGLMHITANSKFAVFSDDDVSLNMSNYQSSRFSIQPRRTGDEKRSRFVFSYDRDNYINNKDDKILVGLGFVPRYLSLINYP